MYRLFAALPAPPEWTAPLAKLQTGLTGASWRPTRNFHITLRFFGDLNREAAEDLDAELGEISLSAFDLSVAGVGWFGRKEPTAVWARIDTSEALQDLSAKCERAARRLGLAPDKRPFIPHITLAYLHATLSGDVQAWAEPRQSFRAGPALADRWHLYSSHPGKGATRYVAEADYVLL